MKVYHGSLVAVEQPKILPRENGKTCDFGIGFYTTTSYEQAKKWVLTKITKSEESTPNGFVSAYEVSDNILKDKSLRSKVFKKADKKWLDFAIQNRTNSSFDHGFDIVYGPVANDRVYTTINLYESGLVNIKTTLQELKTYKLADQILFHTEKAITHLHYVTSEKIS